MKRALVAAIAAALTTAAVLSASGIGATTTKKVSGHHRHAHRAQTGATGATGPWGAKPSGPPPTMATVQAQMEQHRAAEQQKLADKLGVSLSKLQDAMASVEAKALADAVKNNRLTQAEADAITACKKAPLTCDRSNLPAFGGPGMGHHMGPGMGPGFGGPHDGGGLQALADALGVSPDKLQAALQSLRPDGPGFRGPDGDGPHGGMGGPPGGGFGGQQGGGYAGPPPAAGTGA